MSQNDPSKTPTVIKIAAKEANQRSSAGGTADPGPGDPAAEPSSAPELVDIPDPPTPSQLVVKSTPSNKGAPTVSALNTQPKSSGKMTTGASSQHAGSHHSKHSKENSIGGSQTGPAASNPSLGAPREPTSSRALTGPPDAQSAAPSSIGKPKSATTVGGSGGNKSVTNLETNSKGSVSPARSATQMTSPMNADGRSEGGVVHDETEEGEGEVEQPNGSPNSPTTSPTAGLRGSSQVSTSSPASTSGKELAAVEGSQASSDAGASKMSSKSGKKSKSIGFSDFDNSSKSGGKPKKKVTKFRYHKRITVRTSGKVNPSSIMSKVNKKDHKAGITASTIEDMDPQELMRRAGIKGSNQTHWRVRLRQTKRLTKGGKTTTETKVAYRDSEGNKRVKTSATPDCQKCGKKLEECKCDSPGKSSE